MPGRSGNIAGLVEAHMVKRADDRFFEAHPKYKKRRGPKWAGFRKRLLKRKKRLREEWWGYYNEEQRRFADVLRAQDDDAQDPVNPVQDCQQDALALNCTPIQAVKLTSLTYVNGFRDNGAEDRAWTLNTKPKYSAPDWTPDYDHRHPVVVYYDDPRAYDADITYRVSDDDACPSTGMMLSAKMENNQDIVAHTQQDDVPFRPGVDLRRQFTSREMPSLSIARHRFTDRDWFAGTAGRMFEMGTPANEIFQTWGVPRTGEYLEDGATLSRLRYSVDAASKANSVDELVVIKSLFKQFERYTLGYQSESQANRDAIDKNENFKQLLSDVGWPSFTPDVQKAIHGEKVGAWWLADFMDISGECQAICRYVRAVMRQLGAKSKIEFRNYTADFSDHIRVIDNNKTTGPDPTKMYAMVDGPVEVGKTYTKADVGFNHFEAYLKVTPPGGGAPTLFGGGVDPDKQFEHPLRCFHSIVEMEDDIFPVVDENGKETWETGFKIVRKKDYTEETVAGWDGHLP
jgi:hypothetical protein